MKFSDQYLAREYNLVLRWFQRLVVLTWFLRVMRGWSAVITWLQSAVTWLVRRGYSPVIRPVDGQEHSATAPNVRFHFSYKILRDNSTACLIDFEFW